jgi:hypothetical protein
MSIDKEMCKDIKHEWGNIAPLNHYATLFDHQHGYSFACIFSIGDSEDQRKIVLGLANLSSNNYEVVTLSSNVELIENMCEVVQTLFPTLTFEGYRDLIFDIIDESIVPVLRKYEKEFPSGYELLEAGPLDVSSDKNNNSLVYYASFHDLKFNYKLVPVIEDILHKTLAI